jgi:hypothetical protein
MSRRTAPPARPAHSAPPPADASAKSPAKTKGETNAEPNWPPPLRPRRGLFIALLCVFALWVGVLVWMRFKTMQPIEHAPAATKALAMR